MPALLYNVLLYNILPCSALCPLYARSLCPLYARSLCPHSMPTLCPLYAHSMPTLCPLYAVLLYNALLYCPALLYARSAL